MLIFAEIVLGNAFNILDSSAQSSLFLWFLFVSEIAHESTSSFEILLQP